MKKLLLALLTVCSLFAVEARRVITGPTKTPKAVPTAPAPDSTAEFADTIFTPSREEIRLSGYDKTLRAYKESFFVTNSLPDSSTIIALDLTLDYTDLSGRQLHSADHTVRCHIPPGQTRQLSIPSWDKQRAFYYYRSTTPPRAQATPYKVTSTILSATILR